MRCYEYTLFPTYGLPVLEVSKICQLSLVPSSKHRAQTGVVRSSDPERVWRCRRLCSPSCREGTRTGYLIP